MPTVDYRRRRLLVEFDGVPVAVLSASGAISARAFATTANLKSTRGLLGGRPRPGTTVRVSAGLLGQGPGRPLFTGEVTGSTRDLKNQIEVRCAGLLARTRLPVGEPPVNPDPEAEEEPIVVYTAMTAGAIIKDALERFHGIVNVDIADSGKLFGTIQPINIYNNSTIADLIAALDKAEHYRTFEDGAGVVRRLPWRRVPAAIVARTWTEDHDLVTGTLEESREGVRNRVVCTGLPQQGTTGRDILPRGFRQALSPYVPIPPTYIPDEPYDTPLLESGEDCDEWAAVRLGEVNRLTGSLPFSLVEPDVALQVGQTVAVESQRLELDLVDGDEVRFLVEEITWESDRVALRTAGTLWLASKGDGWNPNQRPVAIVTVRLHRETLADGTDVYEAYCDGSASYDPELGAEGIAARDWGGSPVVPTPVGDGSTAVAVFAGGIPPGATVTHTVTDPEGLTGTVTVPITADLPLVTRDLYVAGKAKLLASKNGQRTWVEVLTTGGLAIPAVGVTPFAPGPAFAWTADGDLYRVEGDDTGTLVLAGAGVTWAQGHADPDGKPTGRVWAGSADGAVRFSPDDGDTWQVLAPAPNAARVHWIEESPFARGDVWMGAGGALYHTFAGGTEWGEAVYTHPNAALGAYRWTSGFAQGWAAFQGPAGDDAAASRLRERSDAADVDIPTEAKPASFVGLAFDLFEQRLYALDVAESGEGRAWSGPVDVSGTLTQQTYPNDVLGPPRHLVRDGALPALLYLATEAGLAKSVDGLQTYQTLLALSGGAEGMMVGYGALRKVARIPGGVLVAMRDTLTGVHALFRRRNGSWQVVTLPNTSGVWALYHTPGSSRVWLIDASDVAGGALHYSDDAGDTWVTVSDGALSGMQVTDLYPLADGTALATLLEAGGDPGPSGTLHARIVRWDGAAWSTLYTGPASGTFQPSFARIRATADGQHIVAMGHRGNDLRGRWSSDGGGTWTTLPGMIICSWGGDFALLPDKSIVAGFNPVTSGRLFYRAPWSGSAYGSWADFYPGDPGNDQRIDLLPEGTLSVACGGGHWVLDTEGTLVEDVVYPDDALHPTGISASAAGVLYRGQWGVSGTEGALVGPVYTRASNDVGGDWVSLDPEGWRSVATAAGLTPATLRCVGVRWLVDLE